MSGRVLIFPYYGTGAVASGQSDQNHCRSRPGTTRPSARHAWNRPVWDSGGNALSPNEYFRAANSGNTSYGVLDNIEMKHLACTGACTGSQHYVNCYNTCSDWTFSNLYLHAWQVALDGNCTLVSMGASSANDTLITSVIDGSDASPADVTCYASYPSLPTHILNNVIHDLANGIVGGNHTAPMDIGGNTIYNIFESNGGSHPNIIENTGDNSVRWHIYNNVLYNMMASGGVLIDVCGNTDLWNNEVYQGTSTSSQPPITIDTNCGNDSSASATVTNNTLQVTGGSVNVRVNLRNSSLGSLTVKNNHFINASGSTATNGSGAVCYNYSGCDPVGTYSESNSVDMTNSTATLDGYTSSQTYVYSPTASNSPTVGAGGNLTSLCSSFSSLCADTTYACTQQTVNGVVQAVCPARGSNSRPTSGAWDVGSYLFSSGGAPQPPTGLQATVE